MVDFYEELNLNPSDLVSDINKSLNQLESTWKRREINNPEKATKMLALILDARNAFKTQETKAQYDHELEESKKPATPVDYDAERAAEYKKWKEQADSFYLNKQPDLAMQAARKAKQYEDVNNPDDTLAFLLSSLSYEMGDIRGSYNYVNEAILLAPNKGYYYFWKACILGDFFNDAIQNPGGLNTALDFLEQNRASYKKALELYRQEGDKAGEIECLLGLAESYALMYNSDYDLAEQYANKAKDLGEHSEDLNTIFENIRIGRSEFQSYKGSSHPSTTSGGGCYVATAVYGSYDCPEVWTLRRYRDYHLAKTAPGRIFIKTYYAVSPTVVRLFGNTKWFNFIWKRRLDKFVCRLQEKGYSSERYTD